MSESLCQYDLEPRESKIVLNLDCKSCKLIRDSKNAHCFERMLRTVEKEYTINSILMENYSLTQFQNDAVDMIKQVAVLRSEIKIMKERKTNGKNAFNKRERGKRKEVEGKRGEERCDECPVVPSRLFLKLYSTLYPDFKPFIDSLANSVNKLNGFIKRAGELGNKESSSICLNCAGDSYKDLTYIFIQYEKISSRAAFMGFSVVIE